MLGRTLFDRFHLDQVLGQSASGTLYLATDTSSGEMLAVKVFDLPAGEMLEQALAYRRAASRLVGLEHPHLLVPQEVKAGSGILCEILPYVPARPLGEVLTERAARPEEGGALPIAEGVELLRQAAQALQALHDRGVAHHNLKPANVLRTGEDGPAHWVLADAARTILSDPTETALPGFGGNPDGLSGSAAVQAAYLSPEQTPWLDETPGPAADWYALGVVAYQALTGMLPFAGITTHEMIRQHVVAPPEPPRRYRAEIPPGLERILLTLLAKHPTQRYRDADTLLADLERLDDVEGTLTPATAPTAPPGREHLLDGLRTALGRTATGKGRLVVLKGAHGVGRETLLRSLLPDIAAAEGLLLRTDLPPGDWGAPFEAPFQVFQALLEQWTHLPDLQRRDILHRLHIAQGHNAAALRAVHPGLAPLLPPAEPLTALPFGGARHRTLHALCEAVRALADPRKPLVLWLSQGQRLDPDSLAWLRLLAHRLADTPALVVVTVTTGESAGDGNWEARLRLEAPPGTPPGVPRRNVLQVVDIPALTPEQSAALLASEAGLPPGGATATRLAQWACAQWGGRPLALHLLLRLLRHRALLPKAGSGGAEPAVDFSAIEAASWPGDLSGLVAHLLEWLPDEALLVLQALAALPDGGGFADLRALLDHLPPTMLLERVEALVAEGWLVRRGGAIRFAHETSRQAALSHTPADAARTFHAVLGAARDAAAEDGEEPPLRALHRAALHCDGAGDPDGAGELGYRALAACWQAQALGGVSFWSARLQPRFREDGRLADLLVTGGIAQVQLGHPAAGRSLLESARALELDERTLLDCIAYSAWACMEQGELDMALDLIEEGLALGGEALPAHPVGSVLSRLAGRAAQHYEHLRHRAGGSMPAPPTPREEALSGLLGLAAHLLAQSQPQRASLADEKIVSLTAAREPTPALVRALVRLGEAEGDPEGGFFAEARHLLDHHAFPQADAEYHLALGRVLLAGAHWREAREALEAARAGFHAAGDPVGTWRARREQLELLRLQGPFSDLRTLAAENAALAALTDRPWMRTWSEAFSAYAAFLAEDGDDASLMQTCALLRDSAERLAALGAFDDGAALLALSGELAFAKGHWGALLETVRTASGSGRTTTGPGGLHLRLVLTEAHLLQARVFPDEQAHHLRQAHIACKPLLQQRRNAARATARLESGLALCEAMEALLDGDEEKARTLVEARLPALDAAGMHLTAGWMRFRIAEALKTAGDDAWLRWGGKALNDFEALGAEACRNAARMLLELDSVPEAADELLTLPGAPRPGNKPPADGDTLWERLAHGGPQEEEALLERWLEETRTTIGAENAQLFRPNGDGQLERRLQASDGGDAPSANRWLVDEVWRGRQAQLVEHYRAPTGAEGFGEAQSLLCAPLSSGARTLGVVLLDARVSRQVFEQRHLTHLARLAGHAATALTLNASLGVSRNEGARLEAEAAERTRLQDWAYHAASEEDFEGLLGRFCRDAANGTGCLGAVLGLKGSQPGKLEFGAWYGDEVHGPALQDEAFEAWFPLPLADGQAAVVMDNHTPLPVRSSTGTGAKPPSEAEQRLLNGLGAGGGLWLPLLHRGEAFGVLLLLHPRADFPERPGEAERLEGALRMLMPTVYHLHRLEGERRTVRQERENRTRLAEDTHLLRALLPPGLGETAADMGEAVSRGVERVAPFLVGEVPGLGQPLGVGKDELLRTLRFYFDRIGQGLDLHRGSLTSIHHRHWIATYQGSADSALWGAQTLYQTLLGLREEASAQGITLPPTGLGLHMGNSLWGALPSGERLTPFVVGGGVREAARLAAMSISFRCGILVSQSLVDALEEPERFDLRHLGKLRPAPGENRIEVYELFSVREASEREPMRSMQPVWEDALRAYKLGRWDNAAGGFQTYMSRLPHDRPARYFLKQCRERATS